MNSAISSGHLGNVVKVFWNFPRANRILKRKIHQFTSQLCSLLFSWWKNVTFSWWTGHWSDWVEGPDWKLRGHMTSRCEARIQCLFSESTAHYSYSIRFNFTFLSSPVVQEDDYLNTCEIWGIRRYCTFNTEMSFT